MEDNEGLAAMLAGDEEDEGLPASEGEAKTETTEAAAEQGVSAEAQATVQEALEASGLNLNDEQVGQLSNDPQFVARILGGETGQQLLGRLAEEILSEEEQQQQEQEAQRQALVPIEEAIKQGAEDGNWNAFGEIMAKRLQAAAALQRVRAAVEPQIRYEVAGEVGEAIEESFGEVLDTLNNEELASIRRSNFGSDKEFFKAALGTLVGKVKDSSKAAVTETQSEFEEAAAAARTAAVARGDGTGVLPGGTVEASGGGATSLGAMFRSAIRGDAEDDDSD